MPKPARKQREHAPQFDTRLIAPGLVRPLGRDTPWPITIQEDYARLDESSIAEARKRLRADHLFLYLILEAAPAD